MSTKNIQCKKRKIVVWIISIGIIAALFFGISKFISYRTMPPFAAEREALEIDYGDYLEIDGFKLWFELLNEDYYNTLCSILINRHFPYRRFYHRVLSNYDI